MAPRTLHFSKDVRRTLKLLNGEDVTKGTSTSPGSVGRIAVYQRRAMLGRPVLHEDDDNTLKPDFLIDEVVEQSLELPDDFAGGGD